MNAAFWTNKRVLLTGHTGFKGSWLAIWLARMGAQVTGLALPAETDPSLFRAARVAESLANENVDIRSVDDVRRSVRNANPEIVIHMAAQALVRRSYRDPVSTFATNVQGTVNILDAVRMVDAVKVVVVVTTDKVYKNREHAYPYRETDTLGGRDPYSASKAAAEIAVDSYRESFLAERNVAVASARAGNVIGGGDWSEDRLIPDVIRAWHAGDSASIRMPHAIRPWQHVLEPLSGYLTLAESIWQDPGKAGAYNFGPDPHEASTVKGVVEMARDAFGAGDVRWGDAPQGPHEAGWLSLETAVARNEIGYRPRWRLEDCVNRTINWYRRWYDGVEARLLCEQDIQAFLDSPR